jgi:IS30 family transposase
MFEVLDSNPKCNTLDLGVGKEVDGSGGTWMGGRIMSYTHLNLIERCTMAGLRAAGCGDKEIGEQLGRHRTTIWRERRRNRATHDGLYRAERADEHAVARRRRARRNLRLWRVDWRRVEGLLRLQWSPEQIAGYLRETGGMKISHETIYGHVWRDWAAGGRLHEQLRGARKQRRKRYRSYDSRGRLGGKRMIGQRPRSVEGRRQIGHWEIDTVHGRGRGCVVTLVERKTGYVAIGKLAAATIAETNAATLALMRRHRGRVRTITADNGSEFHGYARLEKASGAKFYFATPHHAWERGTSENTNGLIRQYLPKRTNMTELTQKECDLIADPLNHRPRKRHGYKTPHQCFYGY